VPRVRGPDSSDTHVEPGQDHLRRSCLYGTSFTARARASVAREAFASTLEAEHPHDRASDDADQQQPLIARLTWPWPRWRPAGRGQFRPFRAGLLSRFWPYARPYRRWLACAVVLVIVAPAAEAAQLWMLRLLVDRVLVPRDFSVFVPLALATLAFGLASSALSFGDSYLSGWIAARFLLDLRSGVFRHVQGLSMQFLERARLGDLLTRITEDLSAIESLVLSGIVDAAAYAAKLVYFSIALVFLQWDLALVAFMVVPGFWYAARRFAGMIKRASRERRRLAGALAAVAEESIANAPLVQAYNQQSAEVDRFRARALDAFRVSMAAAALRALFAASVDTVQVVGLLAAVAIGTWELAQDRTTLGTLLVFVAYLGQLYGPVRGLSRLGGSLASALASAERVQQILEEQPAVGEAEHPRQLGRAAGHIAFEHVGMRYPGASTNALCDVSFEVGPGQMLALVGTSGAGKSTIAKLLLRFFDPDQGRIFIDGLDLRDVRLDELRENIALLLQETLVFDASVEDNIRFGRPRASIEDIRRVAHLADVDEFVSRLSDGYATRLGQRGRRLSGGQRQRVAIARALLRDAPVVILDEPTTGLDVASTQRILDPLRTLMRGRTTIVISHNLAITAEADHIVVLDSGRVVECGHHTELLARCGLYARLYRVHHGAETSAEQSSFVAV
jgi:ATP-binding cassette subfamily B protein